MKLSVALKNKEKLGCKIERFVKIIQQAALDNVPRTIGNNYLKKNSKNVISEQFIILKLYQTKIHLKENFKD